MDDVPALRALGLTEYAARAYVALVALGPVGATAVSEASQVPRTKIYTVLDELAKKGWIEPGRGRPRTFTAVDPTRRIEEGKAALVDEITGARTRLAALYSQEGVQFAGPMWVLSGPAPLQRRLARMIADARADLFASFGWVMPGDEDLAKQLGRAARRGVRVRALLAPSAEPLAESLAGLPIEIRRGATPMRVHFVDDLQGLACFRAGEDPPTYRGVWNPHPEMVGLWREGAEHMWRAAGNARESVRA